MKRIIIVLTTFLSCVTLAETQGELKTNIDKIKTGDVLNVQLEVWPATVESVERIKEYRGNRFLDHFYLSKIIKISPSENNPDYVIADLLIVPLSKPKSFSILRLGDENVNVNIRFTLDEIVLQKDKPLNVWKAKIDPNYIPYLIGLFSLTLISSGLYLKFKPRKVAKIKRENIKWKDLQSRSDFEKKFFELKEETDQMNNHDIEQFKQIIEKRLYVRSWEDSVVDDLKKISERIANGIH